MIDFLIESINQGKIDTITDFITHLKDINAVLITEDDCNLNLLHIATGIDSIYRDDVVNLILKSDEVDINKPSGPGNDCLTAAHIAACHGFSFTLKCLLQHGADPYLLDLDCNTVWDIANANGHFNCVLILENAVGSLALPSKDIDDSIYFSMSTLKCEDLDETLKLCDQSSVIYVKTPEPKAYKKIDENFAQKAPVFKLPKSPPKRTKPPPKSFTLLEDKSNDTIIYTDTELNVTLVGVKDDTLVSDKSYTSLDGSILPPIDSDLNKLTNQEILLQLKRYGESPGPVNQSTRSVYLRRLEKVRANNLFIRSPAKALAKSPGLSLSKSPAKSPSNPAGKSPVIKKSHPLSSFPQNITNIISGNFDFIAAKQLDKEFLDNFSDAKGPRDFFNYLLLDPRKTCNLSQVASESQDAKIEASLFVKFIKAIFYIGKGKNNRPYMHLYQAILPSKAGQTQNAKIKRIQDIWNEDYGVISLHFPNGLSSEEAFARESLMINAIGIENLTNIILGHNKAIPGHLSYKDKSILGTYCLWKAYQNLILNGERQLKRGNFSR